MTVTENGAPNVVALQRAPQTARNGATHGRTPADARPSSRSKA